MTTKITINVPVLLVQPHGMSTAKFIDRAWEIHKEPQMCFWSNSGFGMKYERLRKKDLAAAINAALAREKK